MYAEGFAAKLKHARLRTQFTQREVAKETGIAQSTIASYEIGRTQPDIENLGILATFYGVDLNWLIGTPGENPVFRPNKQRDRIAQDMADDKLVGIKKSRM